MNGNSPTRRHLASVARFAAIWGVLWAPTSFASVGHGRAQQAPAPIERRAPGQGRPGPASSGDRGAAFPRGEHLAEWMNQRSNLTPEQQQSALEQEPGFHDLPQGTQQRVRDRLAQLNAMSPAQRQRVLARNEAMERLTPEQRGEVRGAMGQLGALAPEERREVARTFRALRDLPPEQRIGAYATGRYGPALNDTQRGVLFNLLRVEPMLPPPDGAAGVPTRAPGR